MSSTGAVVYAVGADARTRKLLHDVVRLIAAASRRAGGHDSVRTIFVNYGLHLRCGEIQRLVPAYALKIRALSAADHRVHIQMRPNKMEEQTNLNYYRKHLAGDDQLHF